MKKPDTALEQKTAQKNGKASRRRIIKSAVASAAAVGAASQLGSGKWSKPILDNALLPAHATTTAPECPEGALKCAADPLVFNRRYGDGTGVVSSSYDVTATVCPPVAGVSVALGLTGVAGNNATNAKAYTYGPKESPQLTNASGVATFSEVVLNFQAIDDGTASAKLDLVFSAGTDECMLSLSFSEPNMTGSV